MSLPRIIPVFFISILTLCSLNAQKIEYIEVESSAVGENKQSAITAALNDCVSQVRGVKLSSTTQLNKVLETKETDSKVNSMGSENFAKKIDAATKGEVASFKIISENPNAKNGYEIKLSAKVAKYSGAQSGRLRLALMPIYTAKSSYISDDKAMSSDDVSRQVTQSLANPLVSSRRFNVLDREYIAAVSSERALIESGASSVEELCKLGQTLGADYLVTGVVEDFAVDTKSEYFPSFEKTITVKQGKISVNLRIIDIATRQIKFANSINFKSKIGEEFASASMELCRLFGENCSAKIVDAIYPLRVISVDENDIILNQGGDLIKQGARYEVFTLGKELKDPYTGESLGKAEKFCAVIEVVRVKPKTSDARVVESKVKLEEVFEKSPMLCRPIEK